MDKKILLQDIINKFAMLKGISTDEAQQFIQIYFKLIEKNLEDDNFLKIKDLGTFKLVKVDKRESIDVNTGKRIEIQSHSRITFTPESSLKKIINKPFNHFNTVILNENVDENLLDNAEEEDSLDKDKHENETSERLSFDNSSDSIEKKSKTDSNDKIIDSEEEVSIEVEDNIETTSIENKKAKSNPSEIEDEAQMTSNLNEQTESNSSETEDETQMTSNLDEQTEGNSSETEDETQMTSNVDGQTESNPSETEDETQMTSNLNEQTEGNSSETEDETQMTSNVDGQTESNPSETEDETQMTSSVDGQAENTPSKTENEAQMTSSVDEETDSNKSSSEITKTMKPLTKVIYNNTPSFNEDTESSNFPYNKKQSTNWWKVTTIIISVLFLIFISYTIGYFHLFNSYKEFSAWLHQHSNTTIIKQPAKENAKVIITPTIKKIEAIDSLTTLNDTIITKNINSKEEKGKATIAPHAKINNTVTKEKEATKVPHSILDFRKKEKQVEKESEKLKEKYQQIENSKYIIVGTRKYYKVKNGETLRTIALKEYGSKSYYKYIIVHNAIKNPDIITPGTMIKLPDLQKAH